MQSRIIETDDGAELLLEGRFTFTDHDSFHRIVDDLGELAPNRCVIDLAAVSYLDSAAVGMLLLLRERLDRIPIILRGGNPATKELIRIAKLGTLFEIAD